MLEAAQILACSAAALLIVAIAAWVKLVRGPVLQLLAGGPAPNVSNVEIASQLLVLAVSLSAVAAILAAADWFAA